MEDIRIAKFTNPKIATSLPEVAGVSNVKTNVANERQQSNKKEETEKEAVKKVDVESVVEKANKMATTHDKEIAFKIDESEDTPIIIISDKKTGQVIRQIPSEEMLRLSDKMEEYVGLIYNGRI